MNMKRMNEHNHSQFIATTINIYDIRWYVLAQPNEDAHSLGFQYNNFI